MQIMNFIKVVTTHLAIFVACIAWAQPAIAEDIELKQNAPSGLPRADVSTESAIIVEQTNTPSRPFAFGVETGATMDFSGTETSHFDIDIYGGYRKGFIQTLGMGIGLHPSFAYNRTLIPIYAIFRCNFTEGRSLCFADVKAGMSINELSSDTHNTGIYASAGIGFNLLQNRRFKIHAIASYSYTQIVPFDIYNQEALHGASIRIGITF